MTCVAQRGKLNACISPKPRAGAGFLALVARVRRGIGGAIFDSRRRRVERELAQFLERSGGRLTDDIERQMMQHLTSSNSNLRE